MNENLMRGVWFGTLVGLCVVFASQVFGEDLLRSDLDYYTYQIQHWNWFGVPRMINHWIS
jgi:hypothetical protein